MKRKIITITLVLTSLVLITSGIICSLKSKKIETKKLTNSIQISCNQKVTLTELIEEEYRDIQANISYVIKYKDDEFNTTYTYEYKYKDINDYAHHTTIDVTGAKTENDEISLTKKATWKNVYFTTINANKENWYDNTKKDLENLGYICTIKK